MLGHLARSRTAELLPQVVDEALGELAPEAAHVEHEELDVAGAVRAHHVLVEGEEQVPVDGLARLPVLVARGGRRGRGALAHEAQHLRHQGVEAGGERQLHLKRVGRASRCLLGRRDLLAGAAHVDLEQPLHAHFQNGQAQLACVPAYPQDVGDVRLLH